MSSSEEPLFRTRHLFLPNSRKVSFLINLFLLFYDDLSRFEHILSLCQETQHLTLMFDSIILLCQQQGISDHQIHRRNR